MGKTAEKINPQTPTSNRSAMRRDAKREAARARRRDEQQAVRQERDPRRTPFAGWAD